MGFSIFGKAHTVLLYGLSLIRYRAGGLLYTLGDCRFDNMIIQGAEIVEALIAATRSSDSNLI